jgi:DNA-binding MarR family transcriptional regulator
MVESIPKHLIEKVSILYAKKGTSEFGFQDVVDLLGYNDRYTGQIISKLVAAGWITKKRDVSDKRIKIYRLRDPGEILEELGMSLTLDEKTEVEK